MEKVRAVAVLLFMFTTSNLAIAAEKELSIPKDQLALLDKARKALVKIAAKSDRAKGLLALYNNHAVPALTDSDQVRIVSIPKVVPYFFVAANPRVETQVSNEGGTFAYFNCTEQPSLLLKNFPTVSETVHGIMLAHELVHAEDCLFGGEGANKQHDDAWLIGELHAHNTVWMLLNDISDGGWNKVVTGSLRRRMQMMSAGQDNPKAMVFGYSTDDIVSIEKMFGAQDDVAIGALIAQLQVDVNMLKIALNTPGSGVLYDVSPELAENQLRLVKAFYKENEQAIQQ